FYSKYLQSYEATCNGARRRRSNSDTEKKTTTNEDLNSKVFISLANANSFLRDSPIREREAEESSYPMWGQCCGEESSCNNGDLLVQCGDETNYEKGKPYVCEISREYYGYKK
ncbi:hypothetical protein TrispH2_008345, partial [Trichoplax sp. H2]